MANVSPVFSARMAALLKGEKDFCFYCFLLLILCVGFIPDRLQDWIVSVSV